jgi:Rrf2 family cysteine metabolism transcriptional repressor
MKLSTKMRYGTRALLDLAMHVGQGPTSLKEIAERQEVSVKYLEHLFATLQTTDLVRALRGPNGGYTLSRPPQQINLREVFECLEGRDPFVQCTADPDACERANACVTQEMWTQMYEAAMGVLEATTLADLAQRAQQKQGATIAMYSI